MVQQSLERKAVMQIWSAAAVVGVGEIWHGHGLAAHKPNAVPVVW